MPSATKLCDQDVLELRAMFQAGARRKLIAARFGISKSNVYLIAQGKSHKKIALNEFPQVHRCANCGCPV